MSKISAVILFFGLLGSCYAQNENDSLRSSLSQYYLTDLNLRDVANLIISDSVRPMDNYVTFNILDSISSESKQTRDFFYPAYQNILNKSDGALSEVMGIYSLKFIKNYPSEFFSKYVNCEKKKCQNEFEIILDYVQYEFEMSNSSRADFTALKKELKKCILDKKLKDITELFLNYIEDKL
jgi:hypothetical protein